MKIFALKEFKRKIEQDSKQVSLLLFDIEFFLTGHPRVALMHYWFI